LALQFSQGTIDTFWQQGMVSGIKGQYDYTKTFSEQTSMKISRRLMPPRFVMHGYRDQIVPFADSGALTAKLVKGATLKVYPGFPHGMPIPCGRH